MLLAVEAHFEGYVIKGQVQNILHLGHQFIPPLMVLVLIHPLTQLCLLLSNFSHAASVRSRKHSENRGRATPF